MKQKMILLTVLLGLANMAVGQEKVPKVVVGIVVDQLRTDYIEKFMPLFGEGGFKKIWKDGKVCSEGFFPFWEPDRSSAVASVYTGTVPYYHGIVGNHFLERTSLKVMGCVDDASYKGINTADHSSPLRVAVSTLPDELKMATQGHSYVVSMAPERDAAVLAGGHAADVVLWFDEEMGRWGSSSFYGSIPIWASVCNNRKGTVLDFQTMVWEPYLPTGAYLYSAFDGIPQAFRYTFSGKGSYGRYKTSACMNHEMTFLAQSCLRSSLLGRDDTPDMLCLGYYAGNYEHASEWYKPIELQDIYCRLDRDLEALLQTVDEQVGLDNALFFMTSTGYVNEHQPDAELFHLPVGEVHMERCSALLNLYLSALYGKENYVEGYYSNQLYLNHELIERRQLRMSELQACCTEFLCQMAGVKRVYSSLELLRGSSDEQVRNSINTDHSGDLLLEVAPGWTLVDERRHSAVYNNRSLTPFPIVFYGAEVKAAYESIPMSIEVIAPTVAHQLKMRMPNGCATRPMEKLR